MRAENNQATSNDKLDRLLEYLRHAHLDESLGRSVDFTNANLHGDREQYYFQMRVR